MGSTFQAEGTVGQSPQEGACLEPSGAAWRPVAQVEGETGRVQEVESRGGGNDHGGLQGIGRMLAPTQRRLGTPGRVRRGGTRSDARHWAEEGGAERMRGVVIVTQARGDVAQTKTADLKVVRSGQILDFSLLILFFNVYVLLKYFINTGCGCILKIEPTDWMWDVRYEIKNSAHRFLAWGGGQRWRRPHLAPPRVSAAVLSGPGYRHRPMSSAYRSGVEPRSRGRPGSLARTPVLHAEPRPGPSASFVVDGQTRSVLSWTLL